MGSAPSLLSMVMETSARPSGGRPLVPAKMTSSILPPRRLLAPCSPMTQARASTTLDLPEPLGPTMQVIPGSSRSVVADAKDLNPLSVRLLTYTRCNSLDGGRVLPVRASLYRRAASRPGTLDPGSRAAQLMQNSLPSGSVMTCQLCGPWLCVATYVAPRAS